MIIVLDKNKDMKTKFILTVCLCLLLFQQECAAQEATRKAFNAFANKKQGMVYEANTDSKDGTSAEEWTLRLHKSEQSVLEKLKTAMMRDNMKAYHFAVVTGKRNVQTIQCKKKDWKIGEDYDNYVLSCFDDKTAKNRKWVFALEWKNRKDDSLMVRLLRLYDVKTKRMTREEQLAVLKTKEFPDQRVPEGAWIKLGEDIRKVSADLMNRKDINKMNMSVRGLMNVFNKFAERYPLNEGDITPCLTAAESMSAMGNLDSLKAFTRKYNTDECYGLVMRFLDPELGKDVTLEEIAYNKRLRDDEKYKLINMWSLMCMAADELERKADVADKKTEENGKK